MNSFNTKAEKLVILVIGVSATLAGLAGSVDLVTRLASNSPTYIIEFLEKPFYLLFGIFLVLFSLKSNRRDLDDSSSIPEPNNNLEKVRNVAYFSSLGSPFSFILNPKLGNKPFRIITFLLLVVTAVLFLIGILAFLIPSK